MIQVCICGTKCLKCFSKSGEKSELFGREHTGCDEFMASSFFCFLFTCVSNASSERVEALQPPLGEETVRLVGRSLVVAPGGRAEVRQHGPVVLPLRRLLPVLLLLVPGGGRANKTVILFHFLRRGLHLSPAAG